MMCNKKFISNITHSADETSKSTCLMDVFTTLEVNRFCLSTRVKKANVSNYNYIKQIIVVNGR